MKKRIAIGLLALILLAGAASANILTFKINYFVPRQDGEFWNIEFQNMNFKKSNFQDTSFGFFYEAFLTKELSLVLGVETYSKNKGAYYLDWVGYQFDDGDYAFPASDFDGDFSPSHTIAYSATPIQASIKFTPFGRRGKLIPYIGGGVNATLWSLRMQGDLIDFSDEYTYEDDYGQVSVYPIYPVDAREGASFGKLSFGWQAFGGLMIPIANRLTIDFGGQYLSTQAKLTQGFEGFQSMNIGGFQFSIGINYWF